MDVPEGDDRSQWLVYADWLLERDDPQQHAIGEALVRNARPPDDVIAQVENPGARFRNWSGPFPSAVKVVGTDGSALAERLASLLAHPFGAQLNDIALELGPETPSTFEPCIAVLAKGRALRLHKLSLYEPPNMGTPWQTAQSRIGSTRALWEKFRELREVVLDGAQLELSGLDEPELRELVVRGVNGAALEALAGAKAPKLESLRILVDGAGGDAHALLEVFRDEKRWPALKRVGLGARHNAVVRGICEVLPELARLKTLEHVDLSSMRILDHEAHLLGACSWLRTVACRVNVRDLGHHGLDALGALRRCERANFRYV